MPKIIILPEAKQNIRSTALWYNAQKKGLGKRFTAAVRNKVAFIKQNPKAIAIRYSDIRTAHTDTFPYLIHFYIDSNDNIVIAAVLATAQNTDKWIED